MPRLWHQCMSSERMHTDTHFGIGRQKDCENERRRQMWLQFAVYNTPAAACLLLRKRARLLEGG